MNKEYEMPEDILNYNDNWNTVSGLMEVFHAYNQQQQDEGKPWLKWPDWESVSYTHLTLPTKRIV